VEAGKLKGVGEREREGEGADGTKVKHVLRHKLEKRNSFHGRRASRGGDSGNRRQWKKLREEKGDRLTAMDALAINTKRKEQNQVLLPYKKKNGYDRSQIGNTWGEIKGKGGRDQGRGNLKKKSELKAWTSPTGRGGRQEDKISVKTHR